MATYYETLKLAPTATPAEVTRACDDLYDQWRRLTTHHDPGTAMQANQALQQIEAIRATLSDPNQRRAYDASIGLGGVVAGLADPAAVLQSAPPPLLPPPPTPRPAGRPTSTPTSLWACSKCSTENQPNTKFCLGCSTQLVRECPACKRMSSLVATGICGECGSNFDETVRLNEQRARLHSELAENEMQIAQATQRADAAQAALAPAELTRRALGRQAGYRTRAARASALCWMVGALWLVNIYDYGSAFLGSLAGGNLLQVLYLGLIVLPIPLAKLTLAYLAWRTISSLRGRVDALENASTSDLSDTIQRMVLLLHRYRGHLTMLVQVTVASWAITTLLLLAIWMRAGSLPWTLLLWNALSSLSDLLFVASLVLTWMNHSEAGIRVRRTDRELPGVLGDLASSQRALRLAPDEIQRLQLQRDEIQRQLGSLRVKR